MINNYYLIENNEQVGPFSHTELMERGLSPAEMVLSPLTNEWNNASNLPELHEYFTSQGIYLPTNANAANFWWRLLAYIIDYVVIVLVVAALAVFWAFSRPIRVLIQTAYLMTATTLHLNWYWLSALCSITPFLKQRARREVLARSSAS